ncbi:coil containing protein [Vibrio phage 1.121.O._10N.286.46.C4]|nr:coil containing protein [Vibrio phage 1.121.O._10N.286.46.C4]
MVWDAMLDFVIKYWVLFVTVIVIPAVKWVNAKRKQIDTLTNEVEALQAQMGALEQRVKGVDDKLDDNFKAINTKLDKSSDQMIDLIKSISNVEKDTAVNAAKIEANKE